MPKAAVMWRIQATCSSRNNQKHCSLKDRWVTTTAETANIALLAVYQRCKSTMSTRDTGRKTELATLCHCRGDKRQIGNFHPPITHHVRFAILDVVYPGCLLCWQDAINVFNGARHVWESVSYRKCSRARQRLRFGTVLLGSRNRNSRSDLSIRNRQL